MEPVLLRVSPDESQVSSDVLRCEYEFLRRLDLPGVAQPISLAGSARQPAIEMLDRSGLLLESLVRSGKMGITASLQIACDLARTLSALHASGIVHQDLRPANILITWEGWRPCVIDFSVSSGALQLDVSERDWAYLPPEQTGALRSAVDHRTDIYSLGVLLYRMLTGRLPFEASSLEEWGRGQTASSPPSPSSIAPEVPNLLSDIVVKALAKAPENRYQSARDMERDLSGCLASQPVLTEAGQRAEALRDGAAHVLEMIATGAMLKDVLTSLAKAVEAGANGMLCSILLLDEDGLHLRHGASPSLPEDYSRTIDGAAIGPRHGSCGTAAYRREPVIVSDITQDPLWQDWKGLAAAHNLRACWSAPIFSSHRKLLGVFALYYTDVRSPRPEEMRLVEIGAHIAGIAIEHNRVEQEVRESRDELKRVVESVSDCLWSADTRPDGMTRYRYLSPVIERVTGRRLEYFWRPSEYWFEHWFTIVHPDDKDELLAEVKRLLTGQSSREEAEYRIVLPDGEIRYLRDSIRAVPAEGGYIRVSGIFSDITERKQAEDALRHSRELLHSILNSSTAFVYVKDLHGRYLLVNRQMEQVLQLSRENIIGRTDYDLFSREIADGFRVTDQQALRAGHSVEVEDVWYQPDGLHRFFSIKSPLRDKDGNSYAVCGISTDITERKRLEDQLQDAQKMEAIGKLAGGIAHDFNNLMTIVTGYSELLRDVLRDDSPLLEKIDEIHKAGEQAASLTRQLLAFSRRQVPQPRVLDLNEVLANMMKMLRRLVSENIDLSILTDAEPALIRSDKSQIEQVIMNLVINARDAMPQGGRISISTANIGTACQHLIDAGSPPNCVRLSVSDTGHGIDAETKMHIFEPFFTTKDTGKGTGLGLATVYGIVRQAEGQITVESEPSQGTTFNLHFPRAQAELVSTQPEVRTGPIRGTETILVVEDQDGLRTLVSEILRSQGYRVLPAQNGRDALTTLKEHPGSIDLLITDVVMPQMGGRELVEAWPRSHPETRVLFMSGHVEDHRSLLRPDHAFIEKPFSPEFLLRKVREVLDRDISLPRSA